MAEAMSAIGDTHHMFCTTSEGLKATPETKANKGFQWD